MDVIEAIRSRYTADAFGDQVPPRELIEQLIDCAVWAPNHFMTEPWSFHVIAGAARTEMGEALVEWLKSDGYPETPDEQDLQRASGTAMRSPVMIVVGQTADPEGGAVRDLEDYAACCCAVQNLMLAAHAEGLVTKWGTGRSVRYQGLKDYLGLAEADRIVGFVLLGYPAEDAPSDRERAPVKIDWRGI
ncbi:MAG TPA: nitroreductase [Dehalococcoidia bacterium]|nr:nitroreductase [Dehalococcoidia bacterium]